MNSINGINNRNVTSQIEESDSAKKQVKSGGFKKFLSEVADGALTAVATIAPFFPGGELVSAAANGLKSLRQSTPGALTGGGSNDQISQMWAMQRQNQVFNMQYMQLQQSIQSDNRRFTTLSNLMKVRHDTAKSAINNMHV